MHQLLNCSPQDNPRRRLRLHEKGGKEHEMSVHHLLEQITDLHSLDPHGPATLPVVACPAHYPTNPTNAS